MRSSTEEQDFDELEGNEPFSYPPAERRISTQAYDLSVSTLIEQWSDGTLVVPELQREYVWDNGRASRLIESLILNIPIPPLYFSETKDVKYEVIDGHQRIRSIVRYVNNEFSLGSLRVLGEFTRMRFYQLPEREQRAIRTRVMRAIIVSHESHPSMKFQVFERLNTGSLNLNAQEIRNSLFGGPFNDLIRDLESNTLFRAKVGTKAPRKRMVDRELILRFFALRGIIAGYRPPLAKVLSDFMEKNRNIAPQDVALMRNMFQSTVGTLSQVFHGTAFRLTDSSGSPIERAVNRALFDAQMLSFSWVTSGDVESRRSSILKRLAALNDDEDFLDAIQRATGDRSRIFTRVTKYVDALRSAGIPVRAPALNQDA